MAVNPRSQNGSLRRKYRARMKAAGCGCGICHGRLGPIHYDEPSDAAHPLSFVIDEIKPVSRWREFGYSSARACAEDWNNLQAAHYVCNQLKGNRIGTLPQLEEKRNKKNNFPDNDFKKINISDGEW